MQNVRGSTQPVLMSKDEMCEYTNYVTEYQMSNHAAADGWHDLTLERK
jgi:hypothetical protein